MSPFESLAIELKERIFRFVAITLGISCVARLSSVAQCFGAVGQLILFGRIVVDYHNVDRLTEALSRKTSVMNPGSSLLTLVHTVVLLPSATIHPAALERLQCVLGNRPLKGFQNLTRPTRAHATTMSVSRLESLCLSYPVDVSFLTLSTFVHLKIFRLEGSLRGCDPLPDFAPPVTSLTLANVSPADTKKLLTFFEKTLETVHCRFLCEF